MANGAGMERGFGVMPPGIKTYKMLAGQQPPQAPDQVIGLDPEEAYRRKLGEGLQPAQPGIGGLVSSLADWVGAAPIMRGGVGELPRWLQNVGARGTKVTDELVTAARAGDEAARAKVIDALQGMAVNIANRHARPEAGATFKDLMSEANQAALEVLGKAEAPRAFIPYVQQAMENRVKYVTRGARSTAKRMEPLGENVPESTTQTPTVPREQLDSMLSGALDKLTPTEQQAIETYITLGRGATLEQVGEALGKSKMAVSKNLKTALPKMRAELERLGLEFSDIFPETKTAPTTKAIKPVEEAVVPGPVDITRPARPIAGGSDQPGLGDLQSIMNKAQEIQGQTEATKGRIESTLGKMENLAKDRPVGEEGYRTVTHEAGGVFHSAQPSEIDVPGLGVKQGDLLIYWTDPVTGSTHLTPQHQFSRNHLMEEMSRSRADFAREGGAMNQSAEDMLKQIEAGHGAQSPYKQMPPIGGGSDASELGMGLNQLRKQQSQAGGYKSPYEGQALVPYSAENIPPSDLAGPPGPQDMFTQARRQFFAPDLMNLQHDPQAVNRFLQQLQQNLPPEQY